MTPRSAMKNTSPLKFESALSDRRRSLNAIVGQGAKTKAKAGSPFILKRSVRSSILEIKAKNAIVNSEFMLDSAVSAAALPNQIPETSAKSLPNAVPAFSASKTPRSPTEPIIMTASVLTEANLRLSQHLRESGSLSTRPLSDDVRASFPPLRRAFSFPGTSFWRRRKSSAVSQSPGRSAGLRLSWAEQLVTVRKKSPAKKGEGAKIGGTGVRLIKVASRY